MDKLYIVIPAYNEETNIRDVINDWYEIVESHNSEGGSRLCIIDDGSRDATGRIIDEEAAEKPLLIPIHKENGGHGPAVLYGYRYAVEAGADFVFQTDSDGQTLATEFEGFWRQRKRFRMVIGRRRGRQDGTSRVVVTNALKAVIFGIFHIIVPDANTPYRLMDADVLRQQLDLIEDNEPLPNIMLSVIYAKKHIKTLYRDITFRPRQGGKNSIDMKAISGIGKNAVGRFIELKRKLGGVKS